MLLGHRFQDDLWFFQDGFGVSDSGLLVLPDPVLDEVPPLGLVLFFGNSDLGLRLELDASIGIASVI